MTPAEMIAHDDVLARIHEIEAQLPHAQQLAEDAWKCHVQYDTSDQWSEEEQEALQVRIAREAAVASLEERLACLRAVTTGSPRVGLVRKLINVVRDAHRDVLRVSDAVARLPITDATARAWLRRAGLVRNLEGRDIVIWPEVVEALRKWLEPPAGHRRSRPKVTSSLPRVSLD